MDLHQRAHEYREARDRRTLAREALRRTVAELVVSGSMTESDLVRETGLSESLIRTLVRDSWID